MAKSAGRTDFPRAAEPNFLREGAGAEACAESGCSAIMAGGLFWILEGKLWMYR